MIKEIIMYTVICDGCGVGTNKHSVYSGQFAEKTDWLKQDDNHYCPDCFSYDDDDNLV